MKHIFGLAALVLIVIGPTDVTALETFDFEQRYFLEFGPEVKDHSLIRVDGVYHLFYLRGNPAIDIGHATSPDLVHWAIEPPVMSLGIWDDKALWAPQIIQDNFGNYIMYYTGVNTTNSQQTGIAFSTDLYSWAKLPWPVYNPDPLTWAEWSVGAFSHGRDPFVLEHQGQFYQLCTAKTWFNQGAISCAVSSDRFNWQDSGPLFTNDTWRVMESVQCIERNNKFYMFFTEETFAGTRYMTSNDFLSGWDAGAKVTVDLGHAPEVNQFDPGEWVFSRHDVYNSGATFQYVLRFDPMTWHNDVPGVDKRWPLENNWTVVSGTAFAFSPTFLNNSEGRGENIDVGYEGHSWISTYEAYQGPLGLGSVGGIQGDAATGVMRSRTFTIAGNSINLLLGGGNNPNDCYVALVDANTQEILAKETGDDTDEMDRRYWDVEDYKGRDVYIEIVDNSTAAFGHISCDDIRESSEKVGETQIADGDDKGRPNEHLMVQRPGDAAFGVTLRQNTPNPFNPVTTITFDLLTAGVATVDVFDVRGQHVRRIVSKFQGAGTHAVQWDGRNDQASPLSSGIYFYRLLVDGGLVDTKKMILLK